MQVKLLPITDRTLPYAERVMQQLEQAGIRCELDSRNEKIGYKIRQAQLEKVPYMLVLGDKEEQSGQVAVRDRKSGETTVMDPAAFLAKLQEEITSLAL